MGAGFYSVFIDTVVGHAAHSTRRVCSNKKPIHRWTYFIKIEGARSVSIPLSALCLSYDGCMTPAHPGEHTWIYVIKASLLLDYYNVIINKLWFFGMKQNWQRR